MSSSSSMTEEAIAQSLAQDRPTIDAAIKTYMSWVAARSLTEDDCDLKVSNAQALQFARMLLNAMNGTKIDNDSSSASSRSGPVVTQIWNGLVDSEKKPSRFLGRIALLHAWDKVKDNVVYPVEQEEQASLFIDVFGSLMKQYNSSATAEPEEDSNAHLIWDEPGVELERRRQRRAKRAEDAKERERTAVTPVIEELDEEDEEEAENP